MADSESTPQQVEPRHDGSAVDPSQHGIEGMLHPRPELQDQVAEQPENDDGAPAATPRTGQIPTARGESPEDVD